MRHLRPVDDLPAFIEKGLDCHNGTGYAQRLAQDYPEIGKEALLVAVTEFTEQLTVILEEHTEDFV